MERRGGTSYRGKEEGQWKEEAKKRQAGGESRGKEMVKWSSRGEQEERRKIEKGRVEEGRDGNEAGAGKYKWVWNGREEDGESREQERRKEVGEWRLEKSRRMSGGQDQKEDRGEERGGEGKGGEEREDE